MPLSEENTVNGNLLQLVWIAGLLGLRKIGREGQMDKKYQTALWWCLHAVGVELGCPAYGAVREAG